MYVIGEQADSGIELMAGYTSFYLHSTSAMRAVKASNVFLLKIQQCEKGRHVRGKHQKWTLKPNFLFFFSSS